MNDRWQYLVLLGLCLLITAPLELFGSGVYRQFRRTVRAIVPVALVFLIWDSIAIATGMWTYNPAYVTGIEIPPNLPIEEVLFFVVIPLCSLLTYNAVGTILKGRKR
ncbi:lycopene cyclase domain-containing protein [Mycolicibacterium sp. BK556]|uniref:lycopene cyclase domain-containing protein n=1 Tax=unclassified Mycolicibacterium TaxID=2636767 RepID=UPI00161FD6F9|nr:MULTISPECIES: lycopene cyclase domain-containing protein [unclassified Mycolicibacterium]MBB3602328.1 lycopene cyclase domain-containing protein [Mycolicibacterium sp. BK556]MBB3632080.1 lycopene cyclase domain-containing protein [Mycolicibacterium sp. BK607]MBB3750101.1 lycopene cyclase domain-containing protein [Mycolicibacterium sp. BK634]